MIIQHNLQSINALNNIKINSSGMGKTLEKLSSGMRINRSADDAAGLSISEKMRAQIKGLGMAKRNAEDGVSLIQTAEGAMGSMHDILQRMRELTIQAANGTYTAEDRDKIAVELSSLGDEIDSVITNTQYNTIDLFIGPVKPITFQIGANPVQTLDLTINKVNLPDSMSIFGSTFNMFGSVHVDLSIQSNTTEILNNLDTYISNVSTERSNLGAVQNRLEHAIKNLDTYSENLIASESRIRDTDMAEGMMEFTKNQILSQSANAMLAQSNQNPQNVLTLLR